MANTYVLISSYTVGSGGIATISFTSIPNTYTDLKLVASLRGTLSNVYSPVYIRVNGSSSSYSYKQLEGDGSTAYAGNQPSLSRVDGIADGSTATANVFGNLEVYFTNYLSSNYKTIAVDAVTENNGSTAYADMIAGKWADTAAITQIDLVAGASYSFNQYSTAYLYGVSNA